jgi:methylenetetrahydrofolate reductase (NADPH)
MTSSSRASAQDSSERIKVSFEFFPPKNGDMESQLWESITKLAPFQPDFVSVTYGAGGSTKQPTLNTVARICSETALAPAAHLTCVGSDKASVDAVAREFQAVGVNHFVALRGDPPEGVGAAYQPYPGGYANGAELVAGLRAMADFEISVSAYPERHPESPDFATDIDMLKRKVDAGATRAITQFFFDNNIYERYVERVRRAGIYIPIVPGILPIHNFGQVARFSKLWWPRRLPPNRSTIWSSAASTISISTQ